MSRHWYSYIGYGITDDSLWYATMDGVKALGALCSKSTQKLIADCEDLNEIRDTEFDKCGNHGIPALLAEAIWIQEKIPVIIASADEETCILYEPSYPWQIRSDAESDLTEEKLNKLFLKYQDLLDIPKDKQSEAFYQDIVGYC